MEEDDIYYYKMLRGDLDVPQEFLDEVERTSKEKVSQEKLIPERFEKSMEAYRRLVRFFGSGITIELDPGSEKADFVVELPRITFDRKELLEFKAFLTEFPNFTIIGLEDGLVRYTHTIFGVFEESQA